MFTSGVYERESLAYYRMRVDALFFWAVREGFHVPDFAVVPEYVLADSEDSRRRAEERAQKLRTGAYAKKSRSGDGRTTSKSGSLRWRGSLRFRSREMAACMKRRPCAGGSGRSHRLP